MGGCASASRMLACGSVGERGDSSHADLPRRRPRLHAGVRRNDTAIRQYDERRATLTVRDTAPGIHAKAAPRWAPTEIKGRTR